MKTLTILSGKGGTGKSTVASNLAILLSKKKKIIAADCDVDAPNFSLSLGINEKTFNSEKVQTNEKAVLDEKKCVGCKKCFNVCNFGAITWNKEKNKPVFNSMLCEGCGACQLVCSKKAITLVKVNNGKIEEIKSKFNFPIFSGQLNIGSTGSGKIVSLVKQRAEERARKENYDYILVDSAAGVGCPVIASIQNSDFVLAVTEPTPSGLSDLKRALRTVQQFRIPYGIIINRYDLNKLFTKKIQEFSEKYNIPILGLIPYDKKFVKALVNLQPVIDYDKKFEPLFQKILDNTLSECNK